MYTPLSPPPSRKTIPEGRVIQHPAPDPCSETGRDHSHLRATKVGWYRAREIHRLSPREISRRRSACGPPAEAAALPDGQQRLPQEVVRRTRATFATRAAEQITRLPVERQGAAAMSGVGACPVTYRSLLVLRLFKIKVQFLVSGDSGPR